ncbi:hypothetical protein [Mycobacterium antarcticum]|nr:MULTISPECIES: hypothetical protein [unclassified Mycolicibacterium]
MTTQTGITMLTPTSALARTYTRVESSAVNATMVAIACEPVAAPGN